MSTNTTKIEAFHVGTAAKMLDRIRDRLFKVERATARRKTPDRFAKLDSGDDLSGWDATDLRLAAEIGVPIEGIAARVCARIDERLANWK